MIWQMASVAISLDQGTVAAFRDDCIRGLSATRKSIPAKWLYDAAGSALFDRICDLPEYYPYRTEVALLEQAAPAIAGSLSHGTALVELGSGASRKTRILLDTLPMVSAYVPIDINPDEVARVSTRIASDYPLLQVRPIVADFTDPHGLAGLASTGPILAFFPGSTLGNLRYPEAVALLEAIRYGVGTGGKLLLGIDMLKGERTLIPAYADSAGVTATFNLNLLHRINRELGGDIPVEAFAHRAIWNEVSHRVEMHLVALRDVSFRIGNSSFGIAEGESIHTENSHKWSLTELERMFDAAGWRGDARWQADDPTFLVALLDA